jgi:hypothetical protein
MKLFAHIAEIAEDEECMVVVLIDEVESITASRGSAARSNEPGDAVRVVNAVLTSLDALKRRPNVLVLCTSNLIASVDPVMLHCAEDIVVCRRHFLNNDRTFFMLGILGQSGHEGPPWPSARTSSVGRHSLSVTTPVFPNNLLCIFSGSGTTFCTPA